MQIENSQQADHPSVERPHRALISMSFLVLLSLVAEPLTGLADTVFVARLGAESLAALGAGTVALSSVFWVFNFLGIATQTEVAQEYGKQDLVRASKISGLAAALSIAIGVLLMALGLMVVP